MSTAPSRAAAALTLLAVAVSARGQIPPRRVPLSPSGVTRRAGASDTADGVAVPSSARSVLIERDGEVLRQRPDSQSPRRGTAARGARLPALEATQGHGCRAVWVRVGDDAWVCSDVAPLSADPPRATAQPVVPSGAVVPHSYAFARRAGVRTYRRLEDAREDNWAEELERGMSVAVSGTARLDGATYVHTVTGRWVALRELNWARPSERVGMLYEPGEAVDGVGFTRRAVRAWPTIEGALHDRGSVAGMVALGEREGVHVREVRQVRGRAVARLDAGWVLERWLNRPSPGAAPGDLGARERWVDVDRRQQVIVAYEGRAPVYAALVSTGRASNPTLPGEFRVWSKLATTDMSNVDDAMLTTVTSLYTVSRVPWVMFFNRDQAMHGVFWHDGFGRPRSHGCVNLAPRDAAWLFEWAPPAMPPGWNAALPTAREPGMRVRVR
ncbi:MAG: L,D-transpeptidase [Polyangiales bacterium]